jgi:hypothetical protein
MFGMSERISEQSGETREPNSIKNPGLGWMVGFLYIVSFLGLFSVVPLRKVLQPFPPSFQVKLRRCCTYNTETQMMIMHVAILLSTDYDHRLQAHLPEWHGDCTPYQQLPHPSGRQACQVRSAAAVTDLSEYVPADTHPKN